MANNQSQNSSSTKSQSNGNGSHKATSQGSQSSSQNSPTASQSMSAGSTGGNVDAIEQMISKGVSSLLQKLEPELNRIGTQIVNRAMSRGQDIADTGVKRMQDQPWYMVGGAIALVAVGVGLLFAYENAPAPDFSRAQ